MQEQGIATFRPLFGVLLAETQAAAGLHDLALASVHCELSRISQTGERCFSRRQKTSMGEILLASRRDAKGAEAAFLRAIDVARAQSARQFERSAAGVLRDYGRNRWQPGQAGPLSFLARIKSTEVKVALGRQIVMRGDPAVAFFLAAPNYRVHHRWRGRCRCDLDCG